MSPLMSSLSDVIVRRHLLSVFQASTSAAKTVSEMVNRCPTCGHFWPLLTSKASARVLVALLVCLVAKEAEASAQTSELLVLSSPEGLRLSDSTEPISGSSVADFVSLSLGYSLPKALHWSGVEAVTDVFALAKVGVIVTLTTDQRIPVAAVKRVPVAGLVDPQWPRDVWRRTEQRFAPDQRVMVGPEDWSNGQRLVRALKRRELEPLLAMVSSDDDAVKTFVVQLDAIYEALDSLKTSDGGLYWFDIASLDDPKYGESVRAETRRLVADLMQKLPVAFGPKAVVTAVVTAVAPALVRSRRQSTASSRALNLAHLFDPSFHSAFGVTAFTALVLALVVFGVSVAMWNVDPGKDSIIYRMTSQRIKKDQ